MVAPQPERFDVETLRSQGPELERLALSLRADHCVRLAHADLAPLVRGVRGVMAELFALPLSEKQRFAAAPFSPGYGAMGRAKALDTGVQNLLETWFIDLNAPPPLPKGFAARVPLLAEYGELICTIGREIWAALCIAEQIDCAPTRSLVADHSRGLHLMHYPALTELPHPGSRRQSRHRDMTLFTLLPAPSQPGLEVSLRGRWTPVQIADDEVFLTTGLLLERVTGGAFPGCLHTVEHDGYLGASRYSTPFFFKPARDTMISVLAKFATETALTRFPAARLKDVEAEYFQRAFAHEPKTGDSRTTTALETIDRP
jgi:isopenicillin N synthase-like dioxygenase